MNRVQLAPAFLLHQRPYRETSGLLEVFSESHGRVSLVARGIRSSRSKSRPPLQVFQRLLLSWSERGDLGTLTGAEADGAAVPLQGDAIFSGWYLNELLMRMLVRHDPHPALFQLYADALASLCGDGAVSALRMFEMQLLEHMGYGLHFPQDLEPSQFYEREPDGGFHACDERAGAFPGVSLIELATGKPTSPAALRDAKRLLREALGPHLGSKPLRTPEVMRALRSVTSMENSAHA